MVITHRTFDTGSIKIHVAEQGPSDGEPVIFLHGFPECWFSWRAQMDAIAAAGFRALAPDLRGYGESDKPRGIANYASSLVAGDVAALARSLGCGPVPIVGHDWGGPITYRVAMDHPEIVSRVVVMNGPHPLHFARLLRTNGKQRRASWYIAAFQIPFLPERMLLRAGAMRRVFGDAMSEEEIAEYERAFSREGVATAALNYYRAAARVRDRAPKTTVIDKPALVIWGMRDFALVPENLEGLEKYLPHVRIERLPNAGHFVQREAADDVSAILLRELRD